MATGPHSRLDAEVEPCRTPHYESFSLETTKAVNSLLSQLQNQTGQWESLTIFHNHRSAR